MIFELNEDDEKTLDSLLAIWLEGNLQAHSFISKNYWLDNQVGVREGLAQARIFVKETDGKAVGFLGLVEEAIAGLFVKEQFQKQGIGEALIQRVKDEKKILTLTVYENNQAALLFYERQGFRRVRSQIDPETQQREWLMRWTRDEKLQKGSRKKIDFNN
ncbi:MAG: GNAT family N-acetyltransferase [Enterococcus aquimarinus]